jgi:hypothetical protein
MYQGRFKARFVQEDVDAQALIKDPVSQST